MIFTLTQNVEDRVEHNKFLWHFAEGLRKNAVFSLSFRLFPCLVCLVPSFNAAIFLPETQYSMKNSVGRLAWGGWGAYRDHGYQLKSYVDP